MSSSRWEIVGLRYWAKPMMAVARPGTCEVGSSHVRGGNTKTVSGSARLVTAKPVHPATGEDKEMVVETGTRAKPTLPGTVPVPW
jgi:hypothetical protein